MRNVSSKSSHSSKTVEPIMPFSMTCIEGVASDAMELMLVKRKAGCLAADAFPISLFFRKKSFKQRGSSSNRMCIRLVSVKFLAKWDKRTLELRSKDGLSTAMYPNTGCFSPSRRVVESDFLNEYAAGSGIPIRLCSIRSKTDGVAAKP